MSWAGPSQGALYALKHTPQFTPVHLVLAPGVFIVNLLQYCSLVAKRGNCVPRTSLCSFLHPAILLTIQYHDMLNETDVFPGMRLTFKNKSEMLFSIHFVTFHGLPLAPADLVIAQ